MSERDLEKFDLRGHLVDHYARMAVMWKGRGGPPESENSWVPIALGEAVKAARLRDTDDNLTSLAAAHVTLAEFQRLLAACCLEPQVPCPIDKVLPCMARAARPVGRGGDGILAAWRAESESPPADA